MKKNACFKSQIILSVIFIIAITSCSPLNPINDFFGIQMNPTDEVNFIIVKYNDIDGITYKNSISMNPKINAWAEFTANDITLKIINNSEQTIPLNYTADQFILITDEKEYILGKGEREEYFKKGKISPKASEIFNLELPLEYGSISQSGRGYVSETEVTRDVLRNYSKTVVD